MANVIPGGYELAPMTACELPEPVATGFSKVCASLIGARYEPVLYVGKQIVHGTNYMLICKQIPATAKPQEHLVKVVLNQVNDGGSVEGVWSLATIKQIV